MTTTTNKTFYASIEVVHGLLKQASAKGVEYKGYEGVVMDSYILYDVDHISVNRNSAKYIIIKAEFLTTWTSQYVLILTDSYEDIEKFEEIFESWSE